MQTTLKNCFPRCFTAVVTPFTEENKVDIDSYHAAFTEGNKVDIASFHRVIMHSIENNVGVVIFGTTGETPTLTLGEKAEILHFVKGLRLTPEYVVIGVGGNDTRECIAMTKLALYYGFTNIMVTTPYYNRPSQTGVYMHFKTISDALKDLSADGRIIMYNVPARTNVNMLPETVRRLCSECSNIVALKEASGDLNQMIQIRHFAPSLALYSGDDALVVPVISIGGVGLISVMSNAYPKEVNEIIGLCIENNYERAMSKYFAIHSTVKMLFSEPNPTPIKYVLHKLKIIDTPSVRLPLVELESKEVSKKLDDFCESFGYRDLRYTFFTEKWDS
jgi:4-hydroxy-tetrahydrodipicolinate synthase